MPGQWKWLMFFGLGWGIFTSFSPNPDRATAYMPFLSPLSKGEVVSGYGVRYHPILEVRRMHNGVDFRAKEGTAVYAAGPGRILQAQKATNGYGLMVEIHHDNTYKSRYAHLSKLAVKKGDIVSGGQLIGYSGNTGLSSGPHLHYEVLRNNQHDDPMIYLPEQVVFLDGDESID